MNWNDKYSTKSIVNPNGHLNRTRIPKNGIPLDAKQVGLLRSAITGVRPSPGGQMMCFEPHHAFVFYNAERVAGYIDICFLCDNYRGEPDGFAQWLDWEALSAVVQDLGMPIENPKWDNE
jgi:hypothetical protein